MKLSRYSHLSPKTISALFGLAVFAFLLAAPAFADTIYAVGQRGSSYLYTIDTSTTAITRIDATAQGVGGLAFDGSVLYAVHTVEGLGTIDPATGVFTPFGVTPSYRPFGLALDTDTGTLYSTDDSGDDLLTFSLSGTESVVGPLGLTNLVSLAYDPQDNVLWGLEGTGGTDSSLYTVDPSTGAATLVGSTGVGFPGSPAIAFDALNDTLYFENGNSDQLYTLNRSSGAATLVGSLNFGEPAGIVMADVPTPEPSTLLLLCTGLAALAGLGWRRSGIGISGNVGALPKRS